MWRIFHPQQKEHDSGKSQRLYARHQIHHDKVGTVHTKSFGEGIVKDIGYGGFSATFSRSFLANTQGIKEDYHAITFSILNQKIDCDVKAVSKAGKQINFCFEHEQAAMLLYLKTIIPFLEMGEQCAKNEIETVKIEGNGDVYGDCDVKIGVDHNSDHLTFIEVTYRDAKVHYRLYMEHNKIETLHTIGPGAVLVPLQPTKNLDQMIFKKGLLTLMGFVNAIHDKTADEALNWALYRYFSKPKEVKSVS